MLDTTTKRRIDECRDILVGKLPDPKSQIEQITIALIYKFMDDMDKEAVELGGEARFFTGEAARYAWDALFDPQLGSAELVKLYDEALESMELNPHIPQLFRDIFKNAYLPYRDPETLRMFLKTIGQFQYSHSEKLGDAFEYLLQVMGSQGDAGQFRTPRHIIDFTVQAVEPGKNDRVLDPACGTAGFLISAFKHILQQNDNKLTPDERKKLIANFTGYDISPDMVRLSLVNLYLHGFSDPHIHEYDTLTSEERWGHRFDVILANPPFMSPKGGIRPHKKFSVSSTRSEVLFVDYIAEHLSPQGRAGVIVPEGVIFQSGKAYKELRKMLVEHYLWAVVSLPSGVFNPYSGVKTSILLMDRALAKKSQRILFVKVENDGFDLGAQRRELKGSQLPVALEFLQKYRHATLEGTDFEEDVLAHAVDKSRIAESGDYNLSGERYREQIIANSEWPMVALRDFARLINGRAYKKSELLDEGPTPVLRVGNFFSNRGWYYSDLQLTPDKYCEKGDLLYAWSASFGPKIWDGPKSIFHYHIWKIEIDESKVDKYFLYHLLNWDTENIKAGGKGVAMIHATKSGIEKREFPLPPLEVQREIVAEIEGYQKIIDGARMVVEHYRPQIRIQADWEMVEMVEVLEKSTKSVDPQSKKGLINYVGLENISQNTGELVGDTSAQYQEIKSTKLVFTEGDILYGKLRPNLNKVWYSTKSGICSTDIFVLKPKSDSISPYFYSVYLRTPLFNELVLRGIKGAQLPRVGFNYFTTIKVPKPPLEVQQEIEKQLQKEWQIVEANMKMIEIFEQKIKDRIAEVWGSGAEAEETEPEREAVEME